MIQQESHINHTENTSTASLGIHSIPTQHISACYEMDPIALLQLQPRHSMPKYIKLVDQASIVTKHHGYDTNTSLDVPAQSIHHCGLLILHDTTNKDTRTKPKKTQNNPFLLLLATKSSQPYAVYHQAQPKQPAPRRASSPCRRCPGGFRARQRAPYPPCR